MKKLILGTLLTLLTLAPNVSAEVRTIDATGEYVVGEGIGENFDVAKERAKKIAMQNASDMAGVWVESISEVQNLVLTRDVIKTISSNVMELKTEPTFDIETVDNKAILFRCHITAVVDDDNIAAAMLEDRKNLDEAVERSKKLEEENRRLMEEMEQLKQQYSNATTDSERQQIRNRVQINDQKFTAAQYLDAGNRAYYKKNFNEAISNYNKAIEIEPQYDDAYYNLGSAYFEIGVYTEAINAFNRATMINPRYANAYYNLGSCYLATQAYTLAVDTYQKAIMLDSQRPEFYNNLGVAYEYLEQYNEAIRCFERALSIDPNFTLARENLDELRNFTNN